MSEMKELIDGLPSGEVLVRFKPTLVEGWYQGVCTTDELKADHANLLRIAEAAERLVKETGIENIVARQARWDELEKALAARKAK